MANLTKFAALALGMMTITLVEAKPTLVTFGQPTVEQIAAFKQTVPGREMYKFAVDRAKGENKKVDEAFFKAALVDVNDDGKPDLITYDGPTGWCAGSGGCPSYILLATKKGFSKQAIETPMYNSGYMIVRDSKSHGLRDLDLDDGLIAKWNGKAYDALDDNAVVQHGKSVPFAKPTAEQDKAVKQTGVMDKVADYRVSTADMNGDGKADILVKSFEDCPRVGCPTYLILASDKGYSKQAIDMKISLRRYTVIDSQHNGLYDLKFIGKVFRWDGKGYRYSE